eukprot:TRINITY_DN8722_c0_g1_i2.p1 TRINITY_DN8722_c0_g1~~TRINITY_DN8722_c0_g1_i2.p1  ORF type:complete len:505 (+),score=91.26 TRINITY_DN8722_c0_g1_i2:30-1517(+)
MAFKPIACFIIASFCIQVAEGIYGLDVSTPVTVSNFKCVNSAGFDYAIVRAWQSNGQPDPNAPSTVANAWSAGLTHVDVYMFPCFSCGNPGGQVTKAIQYLSSHGTKFDIFWLDIEGPQYWGSQQENVNFMQGMLSAAKSQGISVGIYTSSSQWEPIMGSWTGGSGYPLWYAHYDGQPSFSDFSPFGGWHTPAMKQFQGTSSVCGVGIDHNWCPTLPSTSSTGTSTSTSSSSSPSSSSPSSSSPSSSSPSSSHSSSSPSSSSPSSSHSSSSPSSSSPSSSHSSSSPSSSNSSPSSSSTHSGSTDSSTGSTTPTSSSTGSTNPTGSTDSSTNPTGSSTDSSTASTGSSTSPTGSSTASATSASASSTSESGSSTSGSATSGSDSSTGDSSSGADSTSGDSSTSGSATSGDDSTSGGGSTSGGDSSSSDSTSGGDSSTSSDGNTSSSSDDDNDDEDGDGYPLGNVNVNGVQGNKYVQMAKNLSAKNRVWVTFTIAGR